MSLGEFLALYWRDMVSVLGLIISILGFAYTVVQVKRSRTSADQARDAVARMQKAIVHIDTVKELAEVLANLGEIKRHIRIEKLTFSPELCSSAYGKLRKLQTASDDLSDEQRDVLAGVIAKLIDLERRMNVVVLGSGKLTNEANLLTMLSEEEGRLNGLLTRIQRRIGGENE
jgi:hypothetical protein